MNPILRFALEVALAGVLLLAGFAGLLSGFASWSLWLNAPVSEQNAQVLRMALRGAFMIVSLKALVPQLLLTSVLRIPLSRLGHSSSARGWLEPLLLVVAAALAYAVVGPLLLTREVGGLPPMEHPGAAQHLGTLMSTSLGVAAALWAATRIVGRIQERLRPEPGEAPERDTGSEQIG